MCSPVAVGIISAVASVASTAVAVNAQNKQAEASADAAKNAAAADYQQQIEQQSQVEQQSSIDKSERARQAMIERASLRVAQGESGLAGISQIQEMNAVDMKQSYDTSIMEANRSNKISQLEAEKNSTYTNAQGRVNMANASMVSNAMAGLQIGMAGTSGALQGYTMGKSWK